MNKKPVLFRFEGFKCDWCPANRSNRRSSRRDAQRQFGAAHGEEEKGQ